MLVSELFLDWVFPCLRLRIVGLKNAFLFPSKLVSGCQDWTFLLKKASLLRLSLVPQKFFPAEILRKTMARKDF